MTWTEEQEKVFSLRNRIIRVSAAAGSGKTAVLVERIVRRITDKKRPVDIDRLLVVTFTNAAAAEMRERIGIAVEKALEERPTDAHLGRQLTLLHNAQITTIDSFCLYIIRNHFHEIDLEPNFRIGDEGELKLIREDVLKKVFAAHYKAPEEEFISFMEGYASGRSDEAAAEMVLSLYEFSRSFPWPGQWLSSCKKNYEKKTEEELEEAEWMRAAAAHIRFVIWDAVGLLEEALLLVRDEDGPSMYEDAVCDDLEQYRTIAALTGFFEIYRACDTISYSRLKSSRGYTGSEEKLLRVKELREEAKEAVKKLKKQFFFAEPAVMTEQLFKTREAVQTLISLTQEFAFAFSEEKRRKNLVDFHDVEHFALEILVDEETNETKQTAEEFRDMFEEVMVDEYQDSNNVQEAILTAVSRERRGEPNFFMVGDVKQSIYRFRLARPELFMEKYNRYSTEDSDTQRIDLNRNFRSRKEVIDYTNDIFSRIMEKDLGNVTYDEYAALKAGADYAEALNKDSYQAEILLCDNSEEPFKEAEYSDKRLLEAKLVAGKIRRMKEELSVTDKESGELRRLKYSDIVILLRSLSGYADAFAGVLNDEGIPAHTISSTGYFSAVEVQTVLSMLKVLDNPRQDIPLAAVLRSPLAGLTDEELTKLRLTNQEEPFHVCILKLVQELRGRAPRDAAEEKLERFYETYQKIRRLVTDTPVHELIEILLEETGYGNYAAALPAGERRRANLEMLVEKAIAYENTSYKGLFHFIRYIDRLQKYDVDFGEADLLSENEDVVRIMSIHKSKGLEFPVVFVSGLGKNFNKQDVRSRMVLHPEYGIGLDYMDGSRRIKTPTIIKKAIAKQIELENLGEELRVLYVALTRAKEKLILTGNKKDAQNICRKLCSRTGNRLLPYLQREGAATYLDWILPAVFSFGEKYHVTIVGAEELMTDEAFHQAESLFERERRLAEVNAADEAAYQNIEETFAKVYPLETDLTRKNKYSVSELKHRAMRRVFEQEEQEAERLFPEEEIIPYIPGFIRREEGLADEDGISQGALRGTAMHRVMECYDFTADLLPEQQIEEMRKKELLSEEMERLVKLPLIESFLSSEIGKRMKRAQEQGLLYREKPFVMGLTGKELAAFGFAKENGESSDLTLVQGIIDVFWIEDGKIVLMDYKTDRVSSEKELRDRYQAQLALYAGALNRVFFKQGLTVKERLIYSFRLEKLIPV